MQRTYNYILCLCITIKIKKNDNIHSLFVKNLRGVVTIVFSQISTFSSSIHMHRIAAGDDAPAA